MEAYIFTRYSDLSADNIKRESIAGDIGGAAESAEPTYNQGNSFVGQPLEEGNVCLAGRKAEIIIGSRSSLSGNI